MRIKKGEGQNRKTRIDCNFEISSMAFSKLCEIWGKRPQTTDEFYSLLVETDVEVMKATRHLCKNVGTLLAWMREHKARSVADRMKEIETKKGESIDYTLLQVHISKEDEYFRTALGGILANPSTPFMMIDPKIIIEKADAIAKACMERSKK